MLDPAALPRELRPPNLTRCFESLDGGAALRFDDRPGGVRQPQTRRRTGEPTGILRHHADSEIAEVPLDHLGLAARSDPLDGPFSGADRNRAAERAGPVPVAGGRAS